MISSIAVIGTGNVAYHLIRHFQYVDPGVKKVFGKTLQSFEKLGGLKGFEKSLNLSEIGPNEFDLILLAVSDDAIIEIAKNLPDLGETILAHTSGATSIDVISAVSKNTGVFYPLQTFSLGTIVDFQKVPICIEASNKKTEEKLRSFSSSLGCKSEKVNSDQRKRIHLAAVFANNFTNHLLGVSKEILSESRMELKILEPLVNETLKKAFEQSPEHSQTGPAKRGDQKTMEAHLEMIKDNHIKTLYQILSKGIIEKYN
ncbi:MAG: DUF2520 domain-containing protein [Bacteroidota bacterium]